MTRIILEGDEYNSQQEDNDLGRRSQAKGVDSGGKGTKGQGN